MLAPSNNSATVIQITLSSGTWNAADVRGEVERLIAAEGIVADPAVCLELAEEITARALGRCVPLVDLEGVAEHVRSWTSWRVLKVEADLRTRFAARAGQPLLAGPRPERLPAGAAGKTTVLAAARDLLQRQGRRLMVVTPTLKAAQAACAEVGTTAGSAASLVFAHGWRWNQHGK